MSWIDVFEFEPNEIMINSNVEGYKIRVGQVIHTPRSTKIELIPVKDEVEYEPEVLTLDNEFFFDDFNYLCDMIKTQVERQHKIGEEILLSALFNSKRREEITL